ncbi:Organic hydroperoxide resistance protein [Acidisarcina polymorpha]|uniref:Organic hydroperoxide resistance protein n=1 Tax=Acidisarcina polymorpha TaxID=2211140 RepID=A0A2Z5FVB8_9BACT|nr:organic hydroperoxide resistance protein [Acidisarcina polymorpha]AXC10808.1 Organic hydroperoxide resistance protein [Acidisarcina polymorpha]
MKPFYTASVTSVGGRLGHVESSDGALSLDLTHPPAGGGPAKLANPEMLFAAGYAACFAGAMEHVAKQQKIDMGQVSILSKVGIGPNETGGFEIAVEMDITVPNVDQATAEKLVAEGHQVCPYSNATRGNIPVTLTAHGGKS